MVFPGIITRALEVVPGDGIYSFTHGEGENMFFCIDPLVSLDGDPNDITRITPIRFLRWILAYANDVGGFAAFHDLDVWLRDDNRNN